MTLPQIAQPVVRPNLFRVGRAATPIAAAATPQGTQIRFVLSEQANVTIAFAKPQTGRKVGKTCKKQTKANRSKKACTRWARTGKALTRANLPAGQATVAFTGRIGTKALAPGSYRAEVTAKDAANNTSKVATARFRIAR